MEYFSLGMVALVTLVLGYLAIRSWRASRWLVRLGAGIPLTLLALIAAALTLLAGKGYLTVNAVQPNPVLVMAADATPERLDRGKQIAQVCAGCHAANGQLPLTGQDFVASGPPVGTLWAPNLTPAHLASWSDGEIVRAIREGVARDGRSLLIMPSRGFRNLSDEDVLALVAYLRSVPSTGADTPPRQINLLGALLIGISPPDALLSVQPPLTAPVTAPPREATAEFGAYLTRVGCQDCHGATLEGQPETPNGPPGGPSLVQYAREVSEDQFVQTLRTGVREDGTNLRETMPWRDFELFSDDDFRAIYRYLKALPPGN